MNHVKPLLERSGKYSFENLYEKMWETIGNLVGNAFEIPAFYKNIFFVHVCAVPTKTTGARIGDIPDQKARER